MELYEAKWTELPVDTDAANLVFVRDAFGESLVSTGAILCRAPNSFPMSKGFRAVPVAGIDYEMIDGCVP